jgi:hypothetical protein
MPYKTMGFNSKRMLAALKKPMERKKPRDPVSALKDPKSRIFSASKK